MPFGLAFPILKGWELKRYIEDKATEKQMKIFWFGIFPISCIAGWIFLFYFVKFIALVIKSWGNV